MAVSHQWFLQWTPPSALFSDIAQQFRYESPELAHAWDYPEVPKPTKSGIPVTVKSDSGSNYKQYPRFNYGPLADFLDYKQESYVRERPKHNDRTRLTGLALWMTMLGLARGQTVIADTDTPPFKTLCKWKQIDFEFPTLKHRRHAIATGKYIAENVLPLGLEAWGSRVWITLPSWRRGVPATLATVPRNGGLASPALQPYPNWYYHRAFSERNCTGLTSVFRVNADPCGRLWVLDSGQIDSQDDPKQICPPSVVVFDLRTDKLIARYPIPKKYVLQDSLFSNIIVDTDNSCSNLHVYIADTWRFGLLVFREYDKRFWRFTHHLFYPDPLASNYTLHGLNFQWPDGIFGLALSPQQHYDRKLFFHSMSSYREFMVSTSVLKQSERVNSSANEFSLVGESRGLFGQSSASAIDKRGVMFYGLVSRDSVGCWNTNKPYIKKNMGVVAMDSENLVFPNDVKVDQDTPQNLWVISNRLPMFQAKQLDPDDYNYKVMFVNTEEGVRGSVCDPKVHITPDRFQRNRWN